MAAEVGIDWRPGRVEAPEATVASCPDDTLGWSSGRLLAAAAVVGTACLLVTTPAGVGLAAVLDAQTMAGAPAWQQAIQGPLSVLAEWRVPAAIVFVLGLAVIR